LVVLVATTCSAQITVSDQLPMPVKYPAEVAKMTDAEFYVWATQQNAAAVSAWKAKKAALTEPEYLDGTEKTEHGFKEGYGDSGNATVVFNPTYLGNDAKYYGWDKRVTTTRKTRYPNPNYTSPGPLTIINPYVKP
jgi:hypothetical protein